MQKLNPLKRKLREIRFRKRVIQSSNNKNLLMNLISLESIEDYKEASIAMESEEIKKMIENI